MAGNAQHTRDGLCVQDPAHCPHSDLGLRPRFFIHLEGKAMRRRFSYANVAATLALVFSMSGGALAAKHYLINSTKQINPKVLKAISNDAKPDTTLFSNLA